VSCCGLYISAKVIAPTPEALMRSRYTAYTLSEISYIKQTMCGNALIGFNKAEAKRWSRRVQWISLQILNAPVTNTDIGIVEFIASFRDGENLQTIHELSEFKRIQGVWFYIGGTHR